MSRYPETMLEHQLHNWYTPCNGYSFSSCSACSLSEDCASFLWGSVGSRWREKRREQVARLFTGGSSNCLSLGGRKLSLSRLLQSSRRRRGLFLASVLIRVILNTHLYLMSLGSSAPFWACIIKNWVWWNGWPSPGCRCKGQHLNLSWSGVWLFISAVIDNNRGSFGASIVFFVVYHTTNSALWGSSRRANDHVL